MPGLCGSWWRVDDTWLCFENLDKAGCACAVADLQCAEAEFYVSHAGAEARSVDECERHGPGMFRERYAHGEIGPDHFAPLGLSAREANVVLAAVGRAVVSGVLVVVLDLLAAFVAIGSEQFAMAIDGHADGRDRHGGRAQ